MRRLIAIATVLLFATLSLQAQMVITGGSRKIFSSAAPSVVFIAQANAFTTGGGNTLTSSSLSVTAGQLIYVYCGSLNWVSSISISSTLSQAFNLLIPQSFGSNGSVTQSGYIFSNTTTSATFTCSLSGWGNSENMIVLQYAPGGMTTLDTQTESGSVGGSADTKWVSSSFSTTSKGLVIACVSFMTYGTFTGGPIGGTTGVIRSNSGVSGSSLNSSCEDITTTGPQSNITAQLNTSSSTTAEGVVAAFK